MYYKTLYRPDVDMLSIRMTANVQGLFCDTRELVPGLYEDLDVEGRILALEVHNASSRLRGGGHSVAWRYFLPLGQDVIAFIFDDENGDKNYDQQLIDLWATSDSRVSLGTLKPLPPSTSSLSPGREMHAPLPQQTMCSFDTAPIRCIIVRNASDTLSPL